MPTRRHQCGTPLTGLILAGVVALSAATAAGMPDREACPVLSQRAEPSAYRIEDLPFVCEARPATTSG